MAAFFCFEHTEALGLRLQQQRANESQQQCWFSGRFALAAQSCVG